MDVSPDNLEVDHKGCLRQLFLVNLEHDLFEDQVELRRRHPVGLERVIQRCLTHEVDCLQRRGRRVLLDLRSEFQHPYWVLWRF